MSISPVEGNVIYAGISGYRGAADTAFLFITTDGGTPGTTFRATFQSVPTSHESRQTQSRKESHIWQSWAGTPRVLETTNYGTTWNTIATATTFANAPAKVVRVDSTDGYIYAGTYAGVYVSTDNGGTWSDLVPDCPMPWSMVSRSSTQRAPLGSELMAEVRGRLI